MTVVILNKNNEVVDRQHFDNMRELEHWIKNYADLLDTGEYIMEIFYD